MAFILLGMCVWTYFYLRNTFPVSQRSPEAYCFDNMWVLGVYFREWAEDHGGAFPFNVSTNDGGARELCESDQDGFAKDSVAIFKSMRANVGEFLSPWVCPLDSKKRAASWDNLMSKNITYRVHLGTNVNVANTNEVLLYCPIHGYLLLSSGDVVDRQRKALPAYPRPFLITKPKPKGD